MIHASPSPVVLYHSPGSCSLACLMALEASGIEYTVHVVRTARGETWTPDYLAINASGKVPALRLATGEVLTENPAILGFVADAAPQAALLPPVGSLARARAIEWLNYGSSVLHVAYRSVFRPDRFSNEPTAVEGIRASGRSTLAEALKIAEARLSARPTLFAVADSFGVTDAYLMVYWLWRTRAGLGPDALDLPHFDALAARIQTVPSAAAGLLRDEQMKASAA